MDRTKEKIVRATSVWAQFSAPALFAPVWLACCRPEGMDEAAWAKAFAGFVRDQVVGGLKFRGVASD